MPVSIRFIVDSPRSAAFNMAADLHAMEQCSGNSDEVVIRFYSWEPAAITIGCMQRAERQLDLEMLRRDGIDWIRRPTGGRAVLHAEDLTYSCVFSRSRSDLGSSVATTYSIITGCLVAGLESLGIATSLQESASSLIKAGRDVRLPCFLAPNRNEIMVQGRKLVGSAQYRSATAVLQHGSIPLTNAFSRLPCYLRLEPEERVGQESQLREKCISLRDIDAAVTIEKLVEALMDGFCRGLGSIGRVQPWREEELSAIEALVQHENSGAARQSDTVE
jgi:lipoate-protein ligase A